MSYPSHSNASGGGASSSATGAAASPAAERDGLVLPRYSEPNHPATPSGGNAATRGKRKAELQGSRDS